jgi:hypothetical protein
MAASAAKSAAKPFRRVSDDSVRAKTGKAWDEWFALLDKLGAREWERKKVASHLYTKWKLPRWWAQMVTVNYEQARGLRVLNQTCAGDFAAGVSRTYPAALSTLYKNFAEDKLRSKWLKDSGLEITTANKEKSIRFKWLADDTRVSAMFYAKGAGKSQLVIDHMKLGSAKDVAKYKKFWAEALERLGEVLPA